MSKLFKHCILILFCICVLPVHAGDGKSTQMKIGYSQGNLDVSLGRDLRMIARAAIQFPASYMGGLKGNRIVKVRLGIGDALTEQQNTIFITDKLDGEPKYVQSVAQLNSGWNEIVLDTPFEITGEELFIGFKYITTGMSLSFDGGVTNNYGNWVSAGQSETDLSWTHQDGVGCLNLQAIVEGNSLPQHDAALYSLDAKKYAQTGGTYPVTLHVRNMAASEITRLDITCNVEEQEPVSIVLDGLSIHSNDIVPVSLDNIVIRESSIYDISFKIDKVNGIIDENLNDNQAGITGVVSKVDYTPRKVLLEQFSTERCSNCPGAHKTLKKLLKDKKEDVIWLIHHSGFYTDDLTIDESKSYVSFYGAVKGYAPAAMLDRSNLGQIGAIDGDYNTTLTPVFGMSSDVNKLINSRVSSPALVTVNVNNKFDAVNRTLSLSVYGDIPAGSVDRLKGNDVRLNIYLVEDSIPTVKQEGADGEYLHDHAVRKVLTNVWGDKIAFTDGKYHSKEYTFTVPDAWKERHMRVIAFVANSDEKNPNNAVVYNAEEVTLIPKVDTSVESEKVVGVNIDVYSISGELFIGGDYSSAVIYNVTGDPVRMIPQPQNHLSISALEDGVYFIQFDINGHSVTRKFINY